MKKEDLNEKILALLLALTMIFALAACGQAAAPAASGGDLVGVAMPTKDLQRWNQDGENMKAMLEKAGYQVDLQYGANDIATQVSQIENMIANGCKVLVIASIDGDSLGTVLAQAKEKNIPVIAYDRLIMNSDAVTYYATFDNWLVGTKQGEFIENALGLKDGKGPFNTSKTTVGRYLYAIGGNETATKLSGIDTRKIYFFAYANMGLLAGLAGILTIARMTSAQPTYGQNYEMDAIGSCFIGGASAYGGVGTVPGVIIGALLMGVINIGMSIMGVDANYQKVVKGLVLLAAVIFDVVSKKKNS